MDNENDFPDPMTDTDRKVGEIVRRIKAELEMHRAQTRDDMRQVLDEYDKSRARKLHRIVSWVVSQLEKW